MANPSAFLLPISLLLFSTTALVTAVSASASSDAHRLSWMPPTIITNESGSCQGSTLECMANNVDDEFEFNRRILQTANTKYIGYGALQRDTVPSGLTLTTEAAAPLPAAVVKAVRRRPLSFIKIESTQTLITTVPDDLSAMAIFDD
ncbi:hypothetical protein GQ457_15G025270 [Hibiscus cannabinus]